MGTALHILMPVLETSIGDREGVMISGESVQHPPDQAIEKAHFGANLSKLGRPS
jgi:hypothetical protein